MVTPPKGDYASVPLNDEGRRVADQWDAAQDGACEAYGAAALLRMPTRLRISWDGDERLVVETDAGRQVRNLEFGTPAPAAARSLQGQSVARWVTPPRPAGGPGSRARGTGPARAGGYLEVRTTNLMPGWLRRNGVPYSEDAVLTEYFARFAAPNGDEWLMVTTIVEDPRFLTQRYVTSSHFRREPRGGQWNPEALRSRRMTPRIICVALLAAAAAAGAPSARIHAAPQPAWHVRDNIYMLVGAGGNTTVAHRRRRRAGRRHEVTDGIAACFSTRFGKSRANRSAT